MRLGLVTLSVALVLAGCVLRPRYGDFIDKSTTDAKVDFIVIDTDSNQPVPGAKIEMSEFKNKLVVTTSPEGTFSVPVDKKYVDENPVFVVTLPKGSIHYRIDRAPAAPSFSPPVTEEPPVAAPAPIAPPPPADAGVPATDPLRTNG